MTTIPATVRDCMVSPVRTLPEGATLVEADHQLAALGFSALPVVDKEDVPVGVISRKDLLRVGRMRATNGHRHRTLHLPDESVRRHMTTTLEIVRSDTSLSEAARRMVSHRIHRLYVSNDRRLEGVLGTRELMQAVVSARIATPITEIAHRKLVVVRVDDPIGLAVDRMAAAHHTGLVVVDGGWPVGAFTEADALAARDAPPSDHVDVWMDPRVVCVPLHMPLFRAADQAVATRARRVLVVDADAARGIVTGLDFARLVQARGEP